MPVATAVRWKTHRTVFRACARCHLILYCSKPCQSLHWKQKPAGHKRFCVTPDEERRPAVTETAQATSKHLKEKPCAKCPKPISSSSADCCTLPCSHTFHVPFAEEIRSFSTQVCPICRAELPSEPEQLFGEEGCRIYFPLKTLVELSDSSWSRLTATQTRAMDKVIRSWKVAAEQGYAEVQYHLGFTYRNDERGIPQSDKEALVRYRKAADHGYAEAQCNPGCMYDQG